MGGACSTYGERQGPYRVLVGKSEGKSPLKRPKHRWEDNFKMDQVVRCGMYWINLAHFKDRWQALVNVVTNHRAQ